jgi:hypothetical protein
MLEAIADYDDDVMMKVLEGDDVTDRRDQESNPHGCSDI